MEGGAKRTIREGFVHNTKSEGALTDLNKVVRTANLYGTPDAGSEKEFELLAFMQAELA